MKPPDIDAIARRYEPKTARALLAAWEQLRGQVPVGAIADAMKSGVEAVLNLLGQARLSDAQLRAASEPLVEAMRASAAPTAATFNLAFDLPDTRSVPWVLRTVEENGWLRYGVDQETRDLIGNTIRQAFVEGGHPYETARIIRGSIGLNAQQAGALSRFGEGLTQQGISGGAWERAVARQEQRYLRQRAETIARTETIRAARQGQAEGWREAELEGLLEPDRTFRVWSAVSDACELCLENQAAGPIPYDGSWPNGDYPHPNCRCGEGLAFDVGKQRIVKPLGKWPDFDACVREMAGKLGSQEAARRYCGRIQQTVEGK